MGAGAPEGNRNALKHGYYARGLRPEEMEELDSYKVRGLLGELVIARVMVMRLVDFVKRESCTVAEALPVMKYVFIGLRTIAHLEERLGDWDEGLWEEVLEEVKQRGTDNNQQSTANSQQLTINSQQPTVASEQGDG